MSKKLDMKYVQNHLIDYIKFQLSQGYIKDDIVVVLNKYGHNKKTIEEIFSQIDLDSIVIKKTKKHDVRYMTKELFIYLQELLIDFIMKEKEQGYEIEAIKKALINFGHDKEMIISAIEAVETGMHIRDIKTEKKTPHKEKILESRSGIPISILFIFNTLILLSFIFFTAIATGDDILIILISFFPTLLTLTILFVSVSQIWDRKVANMLIIGGVGITVIIFILMFQLKSPLDNLSEPNTVLIMNIFFTLILGTLLIMPAKLAHQRKKEILKTDRLKESKDELLMDKIVMENKKIEKSLEKENVEIKTLEEISKLTGKKDSHIKKKKTEKKKSEKNRLKIKPIN